ncbi:MAG: M1 family aminopeptidase [Phycisphaerales bacterium]|nr:M1 family aminopeptidase [Phycisphaerales bacterium]
MARRVTTCAAWALIASVGGTLALADAGHGDAEEGCASCGLASAWWGSRGRDVVDVAFDEATGRDLRNFPPDRLVDYEHMRLEITIPDMNESRAKARELLRVRAMGEARDVVRLDARALKIDFVQCEGHRTRWSHDGETLTIRFDPPLPVGEERTIETRYDIIDPPNGLFWIHEDPAWPGRPAQIHTQGQPESNSFWFPCHDFPNDRLTTELVVHVPKGYEVSANGRLVSRKDELIEGTDGFIEGETFHWAQDDEAGGGHANYLVSLIVGKFDVVDVGTPELSIPVYVPPGRGGDVARTYGRTGEMVELFGRLFDEPYPWARYAQLVVWNFGAGGMENTSATTMYDTAVFSEEGAIDNDLEPLISHELAHQWFGDLLTCNSWEHIWLNEGFATYLESLWFEHRDGRDGYDADVRTNFDAVIARDRGIAPDQPAMASKRYTQPGEAFGRAANPYPKGASILHMLREREGDDTFFRAMRAYVDAHKLSTVETDEFRRAHEDASGDSLERFFWQWCQRPGIPRLKIDASWSAEGGLSLAVTQTQRMDADNPAFEFDLPIIVVASDGTRSTMRMRTDVRETTMSVTPVDEPAWIEVDPRMGVLAEMDVDAPAAWWARAAEAGSTYNARVMAWRALREIDAPGTIELARRCMGDASRNRQERAEIVRTLGTLRAGSELIRLMDRESDGFIRAAIVEQLGEVAADEATPAGMRTFYGATLVRWFQEQPGGRARANAVRALAKLKHDRASEVMITAAAQRTSQHEGVPQAAIDAANALDTPEALSVALELARPGSLNRTRGRAVGAIARLAHHDPDAAFEALSAYASDGEARARDAARRGLVELGDPRGVDVLRALAANARWTGDREAIEAQAAALEKKLAE